MWPLVDRKNGRKAATTPKNKKRAFSDEKARFLFCRKINILLEIAMREKRKKSDLPETRCPTPLRMVRPRKSDCMR
jgi:hypothetical protein